MPIASIDNDYTLDQKIRMLKKSGRPYSIGPHNPCKHLSITLPKSLVILLHDEKRETNKPISHIIEMAVGKFYHGEKYRSPRGRF